MMNKRYKLIFPAVFLLAQSTAIYAQTCGFGCLGLSGVYGGYSYQFYNPEGLNKHLSSLAAQFNNGKDLKYERGEGFRIGANIFRAQFDNYFLTAKGYYQFMKEEQDVSGINDQGNPYFSSKLEMNHWGLGIDLGVPLFKYLSWKVVEGGVTFYKADLVYESELQDASSSYTYESSDVNVGYYVGTGLIIQIVPDYISIEGSAFYNKVKINDLINDSGEYLIGEGSKSSIMDMGNVSATLQVNIGVPL